MIARPPGPGKRIATGHIRVDAKRAIAKLREYQLADRTSWILEAIRSAVASDATEVRLRGDSNDVWLDWAGPPMEPASLATLLNELVSPQARGSQNRRLLATAVNTALGLGPVYIDVMAIDTNGQASCARYTPKVLEPGDEPRSEDPDTGDIGVSTRAVATPSDAFVPGMRLHLRRPLGAATLHYLFTGPPELRLVAAKCRELAVPLTINDEPIAVPEIERDQVRTPVPVGCDGFVAVLDQRNPRARTGALLVDIAERGVILTSYALLVDGLASAAPFPVRVFVDSDRQPTNASRSEVRHEAHPVATLENAVDDIVAAAVKSVLDSMEAESDEKPETGQSARAAALGLLAAHTAGPTWALVEAHPLLSPLAELPLIRDACGETKPFRHNWSALCYRGRSALPAELAPWLGSVPWVTSDDPAVALWGNRVPTGRAVRKLVRRARRELRARTDFFAHETSEPRFASGIDFLVRAQLGSHVSGSVVGDILDQASRDQIRGEVCIHDRSGISRTILLFEGRRIEEISSDSAIAFDAIIDCPQLTPIGDYTEVIRDAALERVNRAVFTQQIASLEALLEPEKRPAGIETEGLAGGRFMGPERLQSLLRRAQIMGSQQTNVGVPRVLFDKASIWPTVSGENQEITLRSTQELRELSVIGTISAAKNIEQLGERVLVIADMLEHWHLCSMLKPETHVVRYDVGRIGNDEHPAERLRAMLSHSIEPFVVLRCDKGSVRGAIAWGVADDSVVVYHHVGIRIASHKFAHSLVPATIWLEVDDATPDQSWSSESVVEDVSIDFEPWERDIARAIASSLVGGAPLSEDFSTSEELDANRGVGSVLLDLLASHEEPKALLGEALLEAICELPIFTTVSGEAVSAHWLAKRFANRIPYVPYLGEDTTPVTWPALSAKESAARVAGKLAERQIYNGTAKLLNHRRKLARDRLLAKHRDKAPSSMALDGVVVAIESSGIKGLIALGPHASGIDVQVLIDDRFFQAVTLPSSYSLRAVVNGSAKIVNTTFTQITKSALKRIETTCELGVARLLLAHTADDLESLSRPGQVRRMLAEWLPKVAGQASNKIRRKLRSLVAFPSIQGPLTSITEATSGGTNYAEFPGEWLSSNGDPHKLDQPVIAVAADDTELQSIIEGLSPVTAFDASIEVQTLQIERRMSRGLLPRPTVAVPGHLKRTLRSLGETRLGPGEIGLSNAGQSQVVIHEQGQPKATLRFDLTPSVRVAYESPAHVSDHNAGRLQTSTIKLVVRATTTELLEAIVDENEFDSLPVWLRIQIVCGLLEGELASNALADVPCFRTTAGERRTYAQLINQAASRGSVWYTTRRPRLIPLDEERFAVVLESRELPSEFSDLFKMIDATEELDLDEAARKNRSRERVKTVELGPGEREGALACIAVTNQPKQRAKGWVAPLKSEAANLAALYVYRNGLFLGQHLNPAPWPTVAVIDDKSVSPDRTWSKPLADSSFQRLKKSVQRTSKEALAALFVAPRLAVTSRRVTLQLGNVAVRGRVWLDPSPAAIGVHIELAGGGGIAAPTVTANGATVEVSISGRLITHPKQTEIPVGLGEALLRMHKQLLQQAKRRWRVADQDQIAAHVAAGLALGQLSPNEIAPVEFACVESDLRPGLALKRLLDPSMMVTIGPSGEPIGESALRLVPDDSILFATLKRLESRRPLQSLDEEPSPPPLDVDKQPLEPLGPEDSADRNAAQTLAELLSARLHGLEIGPERTITIVDRRSPIADGRGGLSLAEHHPIVRRVCADITAGRTTAALPVIDRIALHLLTILNQANTEVTDATEDRAICSLLNSATR